MDTREIYSIQDCKDVIKEVLEEELGLGYNICEKILELVEQKFKYTNWNRFQHANCPGCVCGPKECDVAYGRGDFHRVWEKIMAGEIQSCPARHGGTMIFDPGSGKGLKDIDIADHKFNVVKPLEE